PDDKYPGFIELGMGFVDTPFNVPNVRLESGEAQSHVRVGWFRSVNNVAHAWAIQSFVAEIAAELKRDPKDMLLELIGPARIVESPKKATTEWWDYGEPTDVYPVDTGRLRKVAELAAEKAGWGKKMAPGTGLGIAAHRSFVSYIPTASARRSRAPRSWACRSPNMARSRSRTDGSSRAISTITRSSGISRRRP